MLPLICLQMQRFAESAAQLSWLTGIEDPGTFYATLTRAIVQEVADAAVTAMASGGAGDAH